MKKIFVSILTVAMTLSLLPAAAFAETTASNVGNGVDSTNSTTVNKNNSTTVNQSNSAAINNSIAVSTNTGNNTANRNTGGSVNVESGDATTVVQIENMANSNKAHVLGCCGAAGSTTVTNQGNGDSSSNDSLLNSSNSTALGQVNNAEIFNSVLVNSNTGGNDASRNTGGGNSNVDVVSGNSKALVGISNAANENVAHVGSSTGANGLGGSNILLGNAGNGVDTSNDATANLNNSVAAYQVNDASVLNWVGVSSDTGNNSANKNTGGSVSIDSSDSLVGVGLETMVNSNFAALANNCGCIGLGDTVVKNLGNGDSADSSSTLNNNNATAAYQTNASEVANTGYFDSSTGYNDASSNTGSVYVWSDPSITSGRATTQLGASTSANQNVLNSGHVAMGPSPVMGGNMNGSGYWWSYGWNANGSMSY